MDRITSKPNWIFHEFITPLAAFQIDKSTSMVRADFSKDGGPVQIVKFNPPYFLEAGKVYGLRDLEGETRVFEIEPLPVDGQHQWGAEAGRTSVINP